MVQDAAQFPLNVFINKQSKGIWELENYADLNAVFCIVFRKVPGKNSSKFAGRPEIYRWCIKCIDIPKSAEMIKTCQKLLLGSFRGN